MPKLTASVPAYRLHKASGRAFVCLDGQRVYLGKHDSPESREEYNRRLGEWVANGRRLARPPGAVAGDLTVTELTAAFWAHAEVYYRKPDGTPTSQIGVLAATLRQLKKLYGTTRAADFGPTAFKAVRQEMIRLGRVRTNINQQAGRIKQVFKWGVENELVPAAVSHALSAVAGLRKGRVQVEESTPVPPVPEAFVEAAMRIMGEAGSGGGRELGAQ